MCPSAMKLPMPCQHWLLKAFLAICSRSRISLGKHTQRLVEVSRNIGGLRNSECLTVRHEK